MLSILKMANLICAEKLTNDPHASDAEQDYVHWRITFMNLLSTFRDQSFNKLHYRSKYISAQVG